MLRKFCSVWKKSLWMNLRAVLILFCKYSGVFWLVKFSMARAEMSSRIQQSRRWEISLKRDTMMEQLLMPSLINTCVGCFTGFWCTASPPKKYRILPCLLQFCLTLEFMDRASYTSFRCHLLSSSDTWWVHSWWQRVNKTPSIKWAKIFLRK